MKKLLLISLAVTALLVLALGGWVVGSVRRAPHTPEPKGHPAMATIEYQSGSDAPPNVSDAFVLELRTKAARVPAIPVRPLTGLEVAVAVRYAQDEGGQDLPLDLSAMKRIVIDPADSTACVQPGVAPAELEQAAFHWGLAPLADRRGFVLANLLAAEVVTPDGGLVEAGPDVRRDIRTGRATGIVVDATYRLHPVAELRR